MSDRLTVVVRMRRSKRRLFLLLADRSNFREIPVAYWLELAQTGVVVKAGSSNLCESLTDAIECHPGKNFEGKPETNNSCRPSWIRGRQHDNNCAIGWSRKELRMRTRTRNLSCRNLWDRETSNISLEYGEKVCRKTQHGDATYLRQAEMEIHFRHAVPNVLRCTYFHVSCARSETKEPTTRRNTAKVGINRLHVYYQDRQLASDWHRQR